MIKISLTVLFIVCVSSDRITHELPRISPHHQYHLPQPPSSPYTGYTSPLRPGYRWPSPQQPQFKYVPITTHHHQLHPHHAHHYGPQVVSHSPHVQSHPPLHIPHVAPVKASNFSLEDDVPLVDLDRPERGEIIEQELDDEEETFDFGYAVKDVVHGDDFSHQVSNDGSKTNGEYRVALPDGRVQVMIKQCIEEEVDSF